MPRRFHGGDHRHQRPLQRLVDGREPFGGEPRLQHPPQSQRHVGILRRIGGGAVEGDAIEADRRLAGAGHLLEVIGVWSRWRLESSSMPWPPRPASST